MFYLPPGSSISNQAVARQAIGMWVDEKKYNEDGTYGCMYSTCGHWTQVGFAIREEAWRGPFTTGLGILGETSAELHD